LFIILTRSTANIGIAANTNITVNNNDEDDCGVRAATDMAFGDVTSGVVPDAAPGTFASSLSDADTQTDADKEADADAEAHADMGRHI
jgi:hypothetical protein